MTSRTNRFVAPLSAGVLAATFAAASLSPAAAHGPGGHDGHGESAGPSVGKISGNPFHVEGSRAE